MGAPLGSVEIWALGNDRHRVVALALGVDEVVTGHDVAQKLAHQLAERLSGEC